MSIAQDGLFLVAMWDEVGDPPTFELCFLHRQQEFTWYGILEYSRAESNISCAVSDKLNSPQHGQAKYLSVSIEKYFTSEV